MQKVFKLWATRSDFTGPGMERDISRLGSKCVIARPFGCLCRFAKTFSSFKTQISCLQNQAFYSLVLTTRKYFCTSFLFGSWLSNLHV